VRPLKGCWQAGQVVGMLPDKSAGAFVRLAR
jgi:hypothetical protein